MFYCYNFSSFFKGQLLESVFGALLSGSCVVSRVAWIVTCVYRYVNRILMQVY